MKTCLPVSFLVWACLSLSQAMANNITVTNVTLSDVGGGTAEVMFDLSWSNAWRFTELHGGTNVVQHDAAWVFIEFRAGGEWKHAWLTATGHSPTGGASLDIGANGGAANVGAFVYRGADGAGFMNCPGMKLRWDYTANGLAGTNSVDISVHAVEMVYIAGGPFWLGSGGTEPYAFHRYPDATQPYHLTTSDAVAVGEVTGQLYYASQGGDQTGPIPAAFPNGFDPFYCMKYEITQGQYTRFLNMLPSGVDFQRFPNAYNLWGHTISESGGRFLVDAPDRACNYISWEDVSAYLDWAGLRPLSELEYEKTCRGPLVPVPDEFAWGDTVAAGVASLNGTFGSGTETSATPPGANFIYNRAIGGPIRAGMFATSASGRHAAGAGYYGVMELTGNIYELIVYVGNVDGRSFTGQPGDGDIATPEAGWPEGTGTGYGVRGGGWYDRVSSGIPSTLRLSSRVVVGSPLGRRNDSGGRGVRTAP